ncbi:MAG: PAS domain S-box protein [Sedimenticola sp.]
MDTASEKANRLLVGLVVFVLVGFLLLGGHLFLSSYQQSQNDEVQSSIQAVFQTVRKAVLTWREQEISNATLWAGQVGLVNITRDLLALERSADVLSRSDAQQRIRNLLKPVYESNFYNGFFIISPDGTSLASSRDSNIGSRNLILDLPGVFETVLRGVPQVTRPQPSDVLLLDTAVMRYRESMPTMFVAAPIIGQENEVIAVLTFRIRPETTLYPILEQGRIGESGETYLFDEQGTLLSKSRFAPVLKHKGVLDRDRLSPFHVKLEQQASVGEPQLTRAVSEAIHGHGGFDIRGYPGYHFQKVVGVWNWLDQLGVGLVTELNLSEAYSNLNQIRTAVWGAVATLSLMLVSLGLFFANHSAQLSRLVMDRTYELEKQRAHFQAIVDGAFDAIVTITDDGLIQSFNPAACKLFGYEQQDVVGRNVRLLMPDNIAHAHDGYITHYRETGQARLIGKARELEARHKDGSLFWIELSLTEVGEDDQHRFVGFIRDISDRKQLQKEDDAYNRTLFEQSPVGLMLISADGQFSDVNPAFARIVDRTVEAFENSSFLDLVIPDHSEILQQCLEPIFKNGGSYGPLEIELQCDHGEPVLVRLVGRALMRQGERFIWSAVEDVSEQRAYEVALTEARDHAEQASRAKSQFLANMSHELRTPLNAVIGYAEMLQEDAGDQGSVEVVSDLQRIIDSARHLLELINEILDISKIEAGRQELLIEPFGLAGLVDTIHALTVTLGSEKNNRFKITLADDAREMIGDEQRVRQILINLVSNAAKFTENGEIVLEISLYRRDVTEWVVFEITDTGIGMTREQLARVFDPFTQADESTTRKYGGTGLGLTIVKQYVDLMDGELDVHSEPGNGTSFTVSLPLVHPSYRSAKASEGEHGDRVA